MLSAAMAAGAEAHAQTKTWVGGSGLSDEWSHAQNWSPNGAPASNGSVDIIKAGTARLTPIVDSPWDIRSLTFDSTAGQFSISGDPLTIRSEGITNDDADTQTLLNDVSIGTAQTWTAAAGALLFSGTIQPVDGSAVLTVDGGFNTTFAGVVRNNGGNVLALTKIGDGTLVLEGSAANAHSGLTNVNGGTLLLNKTTANGAIPANVSVGDGSGTDRLVLGASEQIANGANVNVFGAGAEFRLAGFNETIGTLTMSGGSVLGEGGTLILSNAGVATFSLTSQITSNVDLAGGTRVFNIADTLAVNDAVVDGVISNGNVTKNNAGALLLTGSSANTHGTTSVIAGTLILQKSGSGIVAAPGDVTVGDGVGAATLQIAQSEQIGDSASLTINSLSVVELSTFTETVAAVTMTGSQVTGSGTLAIHGTLTSNASATTATIAPQIDTGAGTRTFAIADGAAATDLAASESIFGAGGITKTGAGVMSMKNVRVGALDLQEGTMRASSSGGASTGTSTVGSLTVGGGKLDLTDNKLIVFGGDIGSWNGSEYTGITGYVQSGRGNGTWNGDGIVTSMSDATTSILTTLAVAKAEDVGYAGGTFGGQSVNAGDVLVMYTWGGDAQLDGDLDGDDYFQIDSNVAQSGSVFGYVKGDFNYDGLINGDDYFIIDSNIAFAQTQPNWPTAAGASAGLTAVPEPGGLVLLPLVLLRRRRR